MGSRMTQGVRESLWEAFSKCLVSVGLKEKAVILGGMAFITKYAEGPNSIIS